MTYEEQVTAYQEQRDAYNAQATECRRLMEVGRAAVPGIRIHEQETAGALYEMLQAGDLSREKWEAWVAELRAEGKIATSAPG